MKPSHKFKNYLGKSLIFIYYVNKFEENLKVPASAPDVAAVESQRQPFPPVGRSHWMMDGGSSRCCFLQISD